MTKKPIQRCAWCGAAIVASGGSGRPRRYCRRSHRQRHYESQVLAERRGINDDELLVERAKVNRLHDLLFVLEAACEDVRTDLDASGEQPGIDIYRQAVRVLLEAAGPLRESYLEPKADPRA
ncbi:MAG: hypothetical protein OEY37_10275 [Gammaproteobacteria bacterium]|nr:hypothetical protein [Gammaproteobacteria bacterium]MDH5504585.1 hypothetical protein [Acidimicrobiia bacterium]